MNTRAFSIIVGLTFVLRFAYSLTTEFWFLDQDVLQIYLIGLKQFTTNTYPYFGADLVYTHAQIPGALQAFLVSALWYISPQPESPFILLSVLLSGSLAFLYWYMRKRIPHFPRILLWLMIMLLPWPLAYCTRIINPSYVLPAALVFWISFYEIVPALSMRVLSKRLCFFLLGFALLWTFQLHMSWVLFMPFIAYAFITLWRKGQAKFDLLGPTLSFVAGLGIGGSLLFPTLLRYGLSNQAGTSATSVVSLHWENLSESLNYATKFLAFGCFDVSRFIGGNSAERISFFVDYSWAAPATALVMVVGIAQLLWLLVCFFRPTSLWSQWNAVRTLTLVAFVLLLASAPFSMIPLRSHMFVLLAPVVIIYSIHSLESLFAYRWFHTLIWTTLSASCIMYAGIAMKNYSTISMYTHYDLVKQALVTNDYHLVGERRYDKELEKK